MVTRPATGVLRDLAEILRDVAACSCLPGALVARLGGDEFAVVVAGRPPDDLVAYAEEVALLAWRELPHGVAVGLGHHR